MSGQDATAVPVYTPIPSHGSAVAASAASETRQHDARHAQPQDSQHTNLISQEVQPRYPSTNTRQRSSNVNVSNPELEFQRTALNALRSTVSQQEAEIKRLNECMDIRNKRIVQLESQVGHASDLLADRNTSNEVPEAGLKALADKVDGILIKLETILFLFNLV